MKSGIAMKFCSACGSRNHHTIPEGDNMERAVCSTCKTIHYENPRIIAGCVVTHEQHHVLLCKRAIEPRLGYWTLPAGFMENGETTQEAATRETMEEACAHVTNPSLYLVFSVPEIHQVHIYYRAILTDDHRPGPESLETKVFEFGDIPWDDLAFPTVKRALKALLEDTASGQWQLRDESLYRPRPSQKS
jgi:ADP-ribose pyrophosphatase YjhB (NUDIX family)